MAGVALKTCTHCGANISVVAVYCQACSEWLYPTSRPLQYLAGSNPYLKATPAVTGVTLKVCPHCGAHVSVVGVACRACSVCLYPTSQPIKYLAGSNPYIRRESSGNDSLPAGYDLVFLTTVDLGEMIYRELRAAANGEPTREQWYAELLARDQTVGELSQSLLDSIWRAVSAKGKQPGKPLNATEALGVLAQAAEARLIVQIVLIVGMLLGGLALVFDFQQVNMSSRALNQEAVNSLLAHVSTLAHARLGWLVIALGMLGYWLYLAQQSVLALGAENLSASPARVLVDYLKPGTNLFKPMGNMMELWKASHSPLRWHQADQEKLVMAWWVLCLLTALIFVMQWLFPIEGQNAEALQQSAYFAIIGDILALVACGLTLAVVGPIGAALAKWARLLGRK